jgi:hypothetical protein
VRDPAADVGEAVGLVAGGELVGVPGEILLRMKRVSFRRKREEKERGRTISRVGTQSIDGVLESRSMKAW